MSDVKLPRSKVLRRILETDGDHIEDHEQYYSSERQHTSQAFALHIDFRDGLASEGAAWSHFARYRWADLGEHERLRIIFGEACGMEILGHNLGKLVASIRDGQLNAVREMASAKTTLALTEGNEEPVILSVMAFPDFDNVFEAIKAEGKDEHEAGHAGRARGR